MKITYKIKDDLVARAAAQLNSELCRLEGHIYIITDSKLINAKSVIGILSGGIRKNDVVTFEFLNEQEVDKAKIILNEYGVYLGEE